MNYGSDDDRECVMKCGKDAQKLVQEAFRS